MQLLEAKIESTLKVKDIRWYTDRRSISIRDRIVRLTLTEYQLLAPLKHGEPITYANLAMAVYHCEIDEKVRLMMDKHIDRIRGKLRGTGLYIYCVLNYGYILLPEKW
jgi:DNA-binding response OmpR family regulator